MGKFNDMSLAEKENRMKSLKEYSKRDGAKREHVQTTVNIECKQKSFIDENNLNLSRMVRDMLATFMGTAPVAKRKKENDML